MKNLTVLCVNEYKKCIKVIENKAIKLGFNETYLKITSIRNQYWSSEVLWNYLLKGLKILFQILDFKSNDKSRCAAYLDNLGWFRSNLSNKKKIYWIRTEKLPCIRPFLHPSRSFCKGFSTCRGRDTFFINCIGFNVPFLTWNGYVHVHPAHPIDVARFSIPVGRRPN